jgi:hypothetical protein
MHRLLFSFCLLNSLTAYAAEPPKLILPTVPQTAKTLALPTNATPTEVTTNRLEFNGYVAPKEITTIQLEFNGYVSPKEITTNQLEFNGYVAPKEVTTNQLEFNGDVAPKELTTSRLEFNGKSVFSLPKTDLLKPVTLKPMILNPTPPPTNAPAPLSLPMPATQAPKHFEPVTLPVPAQAPTTDKAITNKQLPVEMAPIEPKNKPFLLKPRIVNPQN